MNWNTIETTVPTDERILIALPILTDSGEPPEHEIAIVWLGLSDGKFHYVPDGATVSWQPTHWAKVEGPSE
jgi:hypothetical protein